MGDPREYRRVLARVARLRDLEADVLAHTSGGDGGGNGGSDGGDGGNGGSAALTLIDLRATAAGESIAIAAARRPESASSVDTAAWNGGSPAGWVGLRLQHRRVRAFRRRGGRVVRGGGVAGGPRGGGGERARERR